MHYYELAYKTLTAVRDRPSVAALWESLTWDMSTVLFTYATLLQDYAPLNTRAYEDIEREITQCMERALKLCQKAIDERLNQEHEDPKLVLYQYR